MTTVQGLASKGEKSKQKYQSLDINQLYTSNKSESLETQQQKIFPRKYGMQVLGKVPTTRKPTILPSIKSELSGSNAAVSLVPSGGPGWGKQDTPATSAVATPPVTTSSAPSAATSTSTAAPVGKPTQPPPPSSAAQPVATDKSWSSVMTGNEYGGHPPPYQSPQFQHEFPSLSAGGEGALQQRAASDAQYGPGPSLRPQTEGSWIQGGSRPGCVAAEPVPAGSKGNSGQQVGQPQPLGPAGHAGPGQQPAASGQNMPPQFRAMLPSFMCRGNFPMNGPNNSNFSSMTNPLGGRSRFPGPGQQYAENRSGGRSGPSVEMEEMMHRPIIKEEDLNRMDDMTRDIGWASHDDIDYNQKLAFSDDESPTETEGSKDTQKKEPEKTAEATVPEPRPAAAQPRAWSSSRVTSQPATPQQARNQGSLTIENDEFWYQKRKQQSEEVAIAVERAKLRKEEEEKRFKETREAANKKLLELEEKIKKEKRSAENKENEESQGTINPSAVPPQPIVPVPIPVPDWEKDRNGNERDRSRTPNENAENKQHVTPNRDSADFRQPIEGRNFTGKNSRSSEREISRDRDCRERDREQRSSVNRHFQNMPPRFLKQQAEMQNVSSNTAYRRGNNSSSPQPQAQPFSQQYDLRWAQNNSFSKGPAPVRKPREADGFERDREEERGNREIRRDHGYDSNRKDARYFDEYRGYRRENSQEYDYKRDEKWEKDRERQYDDRKDDATKSQAPKDVFDERQEGTEWRDKYKDIREERPQERSNREEITRPDSRDSRLLKDDYTGNWADSLDPAFEEKKKDVYREERRQVPGPITKEKIEADDLRNEKRHLTQLKHFNSQEKKEEKTETKSDDAWALRKKEATEKKENSCSPKSWVDCTPVGPENSKFMEALEKGGKKVSSDSLNKLDSKSDLKKDEKDTRENKDKEEKHTGGSRARDPPRGHRAWGSGYPVYHGSWSKRNEPHGRNPQRSHRSARGGDWHASDSELSGDEISASTESGKEERMRSSQFQRSPKPIKKSEKDEKNKDYKQDKSMTDRKFDKRYENRNRENFVPRGEPSRHGRGGGFRGTRAIASKRSDGYGIPPSKSPFGNQPDEKDKKLSGDEIGGELINSDEKAKLNQQALSAGIIGSTRNQMKDIHQNSGRMQRKDDKRDNSKGRTHSGTRRQKSKSSKIHSSDAGEECWETTSENSDTENERKNRRKPMMKSNQGSFAQGNSIRQINNGNRLGGQSARNDKRMGNNGGFAGRMEQHNARQNSNSMRMSQKSNKEDMKDNTDKKEVKLERSDSGDNTNVDDQGEEKNITDADGFQEVRSKKNVKERQKVDEKINTSRSNSKPEKESRQKSKNNVMQMMPQQIAAIPPLSGSQKNPSGMMNRSNKMSFERLRQTNLAPRFARQQLQMQKVQMQNMCDVNEMNKLNQSASLYMKDGPAPAPVPIVNAWDKPITSQLRNNLEQEALLAIGVDNCHELEQTQQSSTSSQRSSPNTEKALKAAQVQDKAVLDGTTPLVNTIIFENTNYKSTPVATNNDLSAKNKFNTHMKTQQRTDKTRGNKLEDADLDTVMSNFNKPISDMLNKNDNKPDPIQMPLTFNKAEDNADMKLDFTFDSELTQLTEDKSSKSLGLPRSIHAITSAQSTSLPSTAELNLKIASVKKVWETSMPTVMEHNVGQEDNVTGSSASFSASFGPDHNALDHSAAFSKGSDTPDDNHEGYSPSPNQSCTSNNTTNVCKLIGPQVKPTQQLAGSGQAAHSVSSHHVASQQHTVAGQHSAMVGQNLIGHTLSPPPMQQVLGAGVGLTQPPQQYTSNQHINYQPSLGGSAQYGSMSAIPSPPTVLYNSTQQLPTQGGLYGAFQIDQSQVLNTQGRSQFSQFPNPYGLGQTASSPYNTQSMYLQTAPPHPPPSAQPPPDMYQSLSSQYRMAATGPFAQSQQLTNNPSTVLISSTSNSLMSATVKPSSQQISAIGTKAGTVGQAYQQQSQQGQQLYIPYDPNLQANYLSGTGVLQRGHTGPVQNSVVPGLQPSSSYYSGSGVGAQTGFYQQPGNSTLQSAPLHQHQTSFSLQGNVFGTHNQSHANASLQSFGSQFLSSPMPLPAAAALTAQQQYRSPNLPNPNFLKGVGSQHMAEQAGRSQQLKSPGTNQDVLASVFNSAPQIPSPKSRQNCKQPPPQSSPTQHKYVSPYQTVNNQQSAQIPPTRYPAPIQRPVNFQPALNSSLQGTGNVSSQRHRTTHNQNSRGPQQRQYYGGQGGGMQSSQSDKTDDSKLIENGTSVSITASNASSVINNSSSSVNKSVVGNSSSSNQSTDISKDASKDEAIVKE